MTGRRPDAAVLAAVVTGLAAIAVYRTTLLPGLGAWDTGEAQVVLPLMGTFHPTGFPAYVMLGWLASVVLQPIGSPAFIVNLLSALLAGFAAGTSILVMRRLAVPLPVGIAVATGFALTPIVWSIASAADAHALHLALVVVVTLGLLRWGALVAERRDHPGDRALWGRGDRAIVITAAVFGVALANHALSVLLVPAVGLYVLAVEPRVVHRPKVVLAALGACIGTAALLYLELPLRAGPFRAPLVYGHPETWGGFWETVIGRQFLGDVGGRLSDPGGVLWRLAELANLQLGPLVVLVPVGLLVTIVRFPRYALFSLTATLVTCLFAASYSNAAIERYYLGPAFFAWTWVAVLAGSVADRLAAVRRPAEAGSVADEAADGTPEGAGRDEGPPGPATAPLPASVTASVTVPTFPGRGTPLLPASAAAAALVGLALLVPTSIVLDARWHAEDRSREVWAADWLNGAFASIEQHAVVVSWWSYSTPLWYGQLVEARRGDIWVVDDRTRLDEGLGEVEDVIERFLGSRPVYVIRAQDSDVKVLAQHYAIEPVDGSDSLFRVTGRLETQP
ncbi:MAG: protein O-mannosyl-transferase family [Candidatus Limnocylindrales bacterium]